MILEALDIRKAYGAYVALDGVSLSIREGEFVSIIGPNGAGKSTLLKAMFGLVRVREGRVTLADQDITNVRADQLVASA